MIDTMSPQTESPQSIPSGVALATRAATGAIAAILGYLLSYLLVVGDVQATFDGEIPDWQGVLWYVYNAHMVDIDASGEIGGFGSSESVNFIAQSSASSAPLLYLLPPLVLLAAGGALAMQYDCQEVKDALFVSLPVTLGYAVAIAGSTLVAEATADASFFGIEATGSIGPDPLVTTLVAGVLYPIIFATIGAVAVGLIRE